MSTLNKKPIVPPKVPSRGTSASTEAAQENAEMEVSSVVRPEEAIPRDFTVMYWISPINSRKKRELISLR